MAHYYKLLIAVAASVSLVLPSMARADLSISYTGDYFHNVSGGIRSGDKYIDLLDVSYDQQFSINEHWDVTFFVQGIYSNGKSISQNVIGDIQAVSNLDGGSALSKLGQVTLEINNNDLSLLFGLYDVNSEFDVIESANLFINGSHGIGGDIGLTGDNGPSIYPFYSLAGRVKWRISEHQTVKIAVMDALPGNFSSSNAPNPEFNTEEGAFTIVEYEHVFDNTRALVGTWVYSKSIVLDDKKEQNVGFYTRFEHQFENKRTSAFVRLGYANDDVNQHDWFFGAGVNHQDPFNQNASDSFGIAIARLHRSNKVVDDSALKKSNETVVEITYNSPLFEHIEIQPNLQYIINPSFELDNSLVVGIRVNVSL